MRTLTLEELLEAGSHFGHQVTRHNPKSRDFVFEARDNIHIIDLEKTKEGLENAAKFVKSIAQKQDSTILLLGSKRQAATVIKEEAARAKEEGVSGIYTVTARWIGGTLTNFNEVAKNYKKLKELTQKLQSNEEKSKYTKKEVSLWEKERQKLLTYYDGTKDMTHLPNVLFIIDTHVEELAVQECLSMGIPVAGIVDTNADPDPISYPIPANDDALGSIKLITAYIMDAWIEGKKKGVEEIEEQKETKEKEKKAVSKEEKNEEVEKKTVKKTTKKVEKASK